MVSKQELIDFELEAAEAFNAGKIRAPVHLHGGNEDELIEIFQDIGPNDWVTTSWRSHYHCLLKGVPRDRLMNDILAGKSITLNYPEYNIVSSAIVGGSLPIGLGAALWLKRNSLPGRVHCFAGDMTARTGMYHEVVQYAVGHSLPMRFIIENNGKSVCTDTVDAWGWGCGTDVEFRSYNYDLPYPHSGAGKRVEF